MVKKKTLLIIIILIPLLGCGTVSTLETPDKEVYTFDGKRKELVKLKDGNKEILFDRRGGPSWLDKFLQMLFAKDVIDE